MIDPRRIREVDCTPYEDQRPGTAGLRKKVAVFRQPGYLETYLQAILETVALPAEAVVVAGGDGRFLNRESIPVIAGMCAAHGAARLVTGRHGLLSTPAASNLIRARRAAGGFVLTASHNPGGPDGDFGIKYNVATGGQAPESLTEAIFRASRTVHAYRIAELPELDLSRTGEIDIDGFIVEIVDSPAQYARLMEELFDFDRMAGWIAAGHRVIFDAMHGVTGPYAEEVLCRRLGAPPDALLHATPLPDFGGLHPDPNPVDAGHLITLAQGEAPPELVAASDGDGDRNMIVGPGMMLSPGDSIAIMLDRARELPGYASGVPGVARSMPTSQAVDRVAAARNIPCYETPTGWRYFCNLLEAGRIGLCGEESFGTGSAHTREKDGLWAVLFWLDLLAASGRSLPELVDDHWRRYGRHFYRRQDYTVADGERATRLVETLRSRLAELPGTSAGGATVTAADDFRYRDPVDGSESAHQGIRVLFDDGTRIVYRLSGTGTSGATLRIYLERYVDARQDVSAPLETMLAPVATRATTLARVAEFTGLQEPTASI